MKLIFVAVTVLFMSGCAVIYGTKNVSEFKNTSSSYTTFIADQNSVVVYRNYSRNADARHNDPIGGGFASEKRELDRTSGNGFVTTFHDGRVRSHIEIEALDANTSLVKAWWHVASTYSECSLRRVADSKFACENSQKWPAQPRN
jgi:hypothetical protein